MIDLLAIRPGDRVTIKTPHGNKLTGRVVFAPTRVTPWAVLNLGGAHGKPGVANAANIVAHKPATPPNVDLYRLGFAELEAIARDRKHPQRQEADELLEQWQADDVARHTPAGGEA
jgi:hypothetical protein